MNNLSFKPTDVNHDGLTTLIKNLGRDCPPSQYLREFLKNAIEACQRIPNNNHQIILDFNEDIYKASGYYKLSITDNGDGMTGEQMLSLLNNLSASGSTKSKYQNYGVGAKISAMTRNHEGILYESYQNNQGFAVLIRYLPEGNIFGVQGFEEDGEIVYARKLDLSIKPILINSYGTRVTLFGMYSDQDTMIPPEGINLKRESWIADFINTRFFILPKDIRIEARIGYNLDINDSTKNFLKILTGYEIILDEQSQSHDILDLTDAKAYWWILKEDSSISGHTALINQGEIFDKQESWHNSLGPFGIIVGRNRIVIYIESDEAEQNTPRTSLVKHDGSKLSWQKWHQEFRENMPPAIKDFISELLNSSAQKSHAKNIRNRLKELMQLFILSGFKPITLLAQYEDSNDPKNLVLVNQVSDRTETVDQENMPDIKNQQDEDIKDDPNNDINKLNSSEPNLNFFPQVKWTNEEKSPQLAGMAAEYLPTSHLVLVNHDFKGFKDLIQFFINQYSDSDEMIEKITSTVNEVIEQAFMEVVAGVLSLNGTQAQWTNDWRGARALCPEALTAVIMQRYWMVAFIKKKLKVGINN